MTSGMRLGFGLPYWRDGETTNYRDLRSLTKQAERLGVDSVWYPDHFFLSRIPGQRAGLLECSTLLTALAEATSTIRLGSLVLCQSFRSPSLLAKMAATLQEIAEGRLILGIGAGWFESEYNAYGFPFDHRAGRFAEYAKILTTMLRNEEVTFEGRYHRVSQARLLPAGPKTPIWFASLRDRMNTLTAKYADGWNGAWYGFDVAPFRRRLDSLKEKVAAEGRAPSSLEYSVGVLAVPVADDVSVAPTLAAIRAAVPAFAGFDDTQTLARVAVGTPKRLAEALNLYAEAGAPTVIVSVSAQPFIEWSRQATDLFLDRVVALGK